MFHRLSVVSLSAHQDPPGQIYESGPIKDCVLSSKRVTETEVKVPCKRQMLGDGVQDTLAARSLLLLPFFTPNLPRERSPPCTRRERDILITRDRAFKAKKVSKPPSGFTIYYPQPKPLCLNNSSQTHCFFIQKV